MKTPREILLKRHQPVEPKLDGLWDDSLAPKLRLERTSARETLPHARNVLLAAGLTLWNELILPCRRVWAGLACAWALIIALNVASYEPTPPVVSNTGPPSREEVRALIEQRQLLAQLIGPMPDPASRRTSHPSGPRSERTEEISAA